VTNCVTTASHSGVHRRTLADDAPALRCRVANVAPVTDFADTEEVTGSIPVSPTRPDHQGSGPPDALRISGRHCVTTFGGQAGQTLSIYELAGYRLSAQPPTTVSVQPPMLPASTETYSGHAAQPGARQPAAAAVISA